MASPDSERAGGASVAGTASGALPPSPWRSLFPLADRWLFLDHAGVAPISTRVREAVTAFADQACDELPLRYPYWEERAEEVRQACGRLAGCAPTQVAFVKNTSEALSLVAEGLDWTSADAVLVGDREFPSNVYPWWGLRRRGVQVRMLPATDGGIASVQDVERALDGSVRVVALSAVAYGTGDRLDLGAIGRLCHDRGALFVVDGIQALGAIAVDMQASGLDCIAADGHKWLCAPEGFGFMAISERLLERLRPTQLGWKSVMGAGSFYPYDLRLRRDAAKLEPGSLSLVGAYGFGAAVDLALEVGIDAIESRLEALTTAVVSGLLARGHSILGARSDAQGAGRLAGSRARAGSGIVTFVPHGRPERVRQELWARGVVTKVRFGGIRVAPHHYQDLGDVERFLACLDEAEAAAA